MNNKKTQRKFQLNVCAIVTSDEEKCEESIFESVKKQSCILKQYSKHVAIADVPFS